MEIFGYVYDEGFINFRLESTNLKSVSKKRVKNEDFQYYKIDNFSKML